MKNIDRIADLALSLQAVNEDLLTHNPYNKLINRVRVLLVYCSDDEVNLFKLLVHGITLLNKLYRVQENGRYIVEREDILTALDIMGSSIYPFIKVSKTNTEYYRCLFKVFGTSSFNRKLVQQKIVLSKTHTNRILIDLEKKGLLTKSGFRNTGYQYQIKL